MNLSVWVRLIPWLSLAVVTVAAELRVDHVTVAGPELGAMQARLEQLGLHVEYGGAHANHATEMAIASFPDGSYIELIALRRDAEPEAAQKHYWAKYMRGNAGPCAWAVRSTDVNAEVERLRKAGVEVSAAHKSGRVRPDGYRLDWETAQAGTEGDGILFPFLIRDFTPREQRAFPNGKPGNPDFTGVARVSIVVQDLDRAAGRFRKAYALPGAIKTEEGKRRALRFEGTPIMLVSPQGPDSVEMNRRLEKFGEGVWAVAIQKKSSGQLIWILAPE